MIAIPNITLGMTTLYNNQTGLTFTKLESWGVIAINLIIFYITYLWAKSERLIHSFSLNRKDIKAIIWGFVIIFLMGLIGSNLMLLTHTSYHAELQKTLTTIPILPVAIGMISAAFLQEILFRKWIFTWLAPYSKTAVLVSTGLFVSFICQLILPTSLFISEWAWLSLWSTKKEKTYLQVSHLHVLWNLYTLGATILVMTNPM